MTIFVTGVLGGNGVEELWNEQFVDLHYEEARAEREAELLEEEAEDIDEILDREFEDFQGETHLYGDWLKNEDTGKWEPDEEMGEFAAIYDNNDNIIQVVWSIWAKPAHYCSPCYPGQGDLDTEGDYYFAYCLPPELMNEAWLEEYGDKIYKWKVVE